MKIQIYEHCHPLDARASAEAGVDFIGVKTGERGRMENEVDFARCRAIYQAIPQDADCMRNALTIATDMAEIVETAQAVAPDMLHLSGAIALTPPERVAEIRKAIAPVKVMVAIPVADAASVALAQAYQGVADYLLLDTPAGTDGVVGATGETHDWAVSADIVRRVNLPVLLAGGLSAGNVAAAVQQVRPWGVDSFTHTNHPGSLRKDGRHVAAFAAAARTRQR